MGRGWSGLFRERWRLSVLQCGLYSQTLYAGAEAADDGLFTYRDALSVSTSLFCTAGAEGILGCGGGYCSGMYLGGDGGGGHTAF